MIDPKTLTPEDVGREVVYQPRHAQREYGSLTSWNDEFVFVRFRGPTGEACRPQDVSFAHEENK